MSGMKVICSPCDGARKRIVAAVASALTAIYQRGASMGFPAVMEIPQLRQEARELIVRVKGLVEHDDELGRVLAQADPKLAGTGSEAAGAIAELGTALNGLGPVLMDELYQAEGKDGLPTHAMICPCCGGQMAVQNVPATGIPGAPVGAPLIPETAPEEFQIDRNELSPEELREQLLGGARA